MNRDWLNGWDKLLGFPMAVLILIGFLSVWRIPLTARQHQVEALDLALAYIQAHETDPLYLLRGHEEGFAKARIPDRPVVFDQQIHNLLVVQKGPHHFQRSIEGLAYKVATPTLHTMVQAAELLAARQGIDAMYPPWDEAVREKVLHWGGDLLVRWASQDQPGYYTQELAQTEPKKIEAPPRGTEEEQLWFAWQRLTAGSPRAAADLPRLADLVRQAYPGQAEYDAAMGWARTLYARCEASLKEIRDPEKKKHALGLPPATDTTLWWLLYQYVGLNDASRQAARDRWQGHFTPGKRQAALNWGRKLEAGRRKAGEPLPPSSDNVALLCVMERLSGMDAHGERCRRIVAEHDRQILADWPSWGEFINGTTWLSITLAYPNDDLLPLLGNAPTALELSWRPWPQVGWATPVLGFVLLGLVIAGLRAWFFIILGPILCLVLFPSARSARYYLRYELGQTWLEWKGLLIAFVLIPLATWGITWHTLAPPTDFFIQSPLDLLPSVYLTVIFGGSAVLFLTRLTALLFIRCGFDVEKTWLDQALGVLVGIAVLYYFENSFLSIGSYVAFALIPERIIRHRGYLYVAPKDRVTWPQAPSNGAGSGAVHLVGAADLVNEEDAFDPAAVRTELQGTWKAVAQHFDGRQLSKVEMGVGEKGRLVFAGASFFMTISELEIFNSKGTFTVDPTTNPPSIDLHLEEGLVLADIPGIYRLEGDTLTLSFSNRGASRPTSFITSYGAPERSTMYQRVSHATTPPKIVTETSLEETLNPIGRILGACLGAFLGAIFGLLAVIAWYVLDGGLDGKLGLESLGGKIRLGNFEGNRLIFVGMACAGGLGALCGLLFQTRIGNGLALIAGLLLWVHVGGVAGGICGYFAPWAAAEFFAKQIPPTPSLIIGVLAGPVIALIGVGIASLREK